MLITWIEGGRSDLDLVMFICSVQHGVQLSGSLAYNHPYYFLQVWVQATEVWGTDFGRKNPQLWNSKQQGCYHIVTCCDSQSTWVLVTILFWFFAQVITDFVSCTNFVECNHELWIVVVSVDVSVALINLLLDGRKSKTQCTVIVQYFCFWTDYLHC